MWSAARSAKISMILCMPERVSGGDAEFQGFCDGWNKWEGQLEPVGEFRLFFGLADATGKVVTEEEWQRFLADTITPRFRAGLTVLEGRGQWLEPTGNLQREPVRVVMGAVAADTDRSMKLVDEISAAFQARFGQDPVFRMWNPACGGIHPR